MELKKVSYFFLLFYISLSTTAAQKRSWIHTRAGATPSGELRYKHCRLHTSIFSTWFYCKSLTDWKGGTGVACSSNLNLPNLFLFIFAGRPVRKARGKHFIKAGWHWSTGSLLSSFCQRTELCPLIQRWKSIHLDKMIQHDMIWAKKQHIKMYITTYYLALQVFRP